MSERWTEDRAKKWYAAQPWLVGSNYIPADSCNQIEMWQADTFNPGRIATELAWARGLGMNTMRVFLHDLLWRDDSEGLLRRMETFLQLAEKNGIRPMFVLFDSVWNPRPQTGPQPTPEQGIHNAGWVQGPGAAALQDPAQRERLRAYVTGVISAFARDARVLAWDIWNEPDNTNAASYGAEEPQDKAGLVAPLLGEVFAWARSAQPQQPLTSGVWTGEWDNATRLNAVQKIQFAQSDVISFHNYAPAEEFAKRVKDLQVHNRPILCTEYMARPLGSTFEAILPVAKEAGIACYNWGFAKGRTQTHLPWDSWQKPYSGEPPLWFHEIFREDGTPYRAAETDFIRRMTGVEGLRAII